MSDVLVEGNISLSKFIENMIRQRTDPSPPAFKTQFYEFKDIWQFPETVATLVKKVQEVEGNPDPIEVKAPYPDIFEGLVKPVITCEIVKRSPGTISQHQPGQGRKAYRPFLKYEDKSEIHIGHKVYKLQQIFDNWVDVIVWASNTKIAYQKAQWFEQTIIKYCWVFPFLGYPTWRLEQVGPMKFRGDPDKVIGIPFNFWVRSVIEYKVDLKTLDQIAVELVNNTPGGTT